MVNPEKAGGHCHCDKNCAKYDDCCHDFIDMCSGHGKNLITVVGKMSSSVKQSLLVRSQTLLKRMHVG